MVAQVYEIISNDQIDKIQHQQTQYNTIVKDEVDRLKLKKSNMDSVANNTDRMILLNQSFRDRQYQYLVIMILFLVVFGICLAIVFLQERLGLTSVFLDLLIIIIVTAGIGTGYIMISNINARDKNDFQKMGQDSLVKISTDTAGTYNSAVTAGNITKAMASTCVGSACCGPGYSWNKDGNNCQ